MKAKIQAKRKPRRCPVCKSERVASILYGMPLMNDELVHKIEAGKIALGGCSVAVIGAAPWVCSDCGVEIFKEEDLGPASADES
jgi:predicted Zn-ribbon and HTH transcriptional regulator